MKKIPLFILAYFIFPSLAFAQDIGLSRKNKPGNIPLGMSIGDMVATFLQLMYIIGALGTLVFIVWGSMDWILAGGDKEKLAAARKKIINSIIGITLLALSAFIVSLVGAIVGIDVFNLNCLPALYQTPGVNSIRCSGPAAPISPGS